MLFSKTEHEIYEYALNEDKHNLSHDIAMVYVRTIDDIDKNINDTNALKKQKRGLLI